MAAPEESGILLEIVTPKGVALRERVDEMEAPGAAGDFGVLVGHLPMLAALDVGLVRYRIGGKREEVAVGEGFAEVLPDRTLVLTDRFARRDDVDVLAVRERLAEVDRALDRWEGELDDPARLELVEEEQWLAAELELIGDPPVPRVLVGRRLSDYRAVLPPAEPPSEP
jgi:F-type H+-transporting ATPase subunit epsilon